MQDIPWNSNELAVALPVGAAAFFFCVYWFWSHSAQLKEWVNTRHGDGFFDQFGALYQKGVGFLLLGVAPLLLALLLPRSILSYGLADFSWPKTIYWILLFGGGLSFIPWYTARQKDMHGFYPQVRALTWDRRLLAVNGFMWALYLLAYEFLFRGLILISVANVTGWWPAIVVTTAMSTIAHLPKGAKETFGTIPFSIVLCLTVIQTGGIWAAVVVHTILAISNDYWALRYHPEMRLLKGWTQSPAKKAAVD